MYLNISNENKMVCIIFIYLRKKKESENSRQYMLYIYEIIFPKDVRELPVNEIYKKKMIHGICMINSVCLFCHVNFFIAPNPFCKCHATTFKKKKNFCHENFIFFLMKKNLFCNIFVW